MPGSADQAVSPTWVSPAACTVTGRVPRTRLSVTGHRTYGMPARTSRGVVGAQARFSASAATVFGSGEPKRRGVCPTGYTRISARPRVPVPSTRVTVKRTHFTDRARKATTVGKAELRKSSPTSRLVPLSKVRTPDTTRAPMAEP